MWRRVVCGLAAVAMTFGLFGCAVIDNRGGLTDQIEDVIFFRADTKSHRLLRAFTLIGTLMAVAHRHGQDKEAQEAIKAPLTTALKEAYEAYLCVFAQAPSAEGGGEFYRCQFFDEKMSRLDYSLYRLALVTLFEKDDRRFLSEVRDRLVGKIPVVTSAVKAVVHAGAAKAQLVSLPEELLQISFTGIETLAYLLPIYRDLLELDMWVIIDALQASCPVPVVTELYPPSTIPGAPAPITKVSVKGAAPPPPAFLTEDPCPTLQYAWSIFQRGNGNLRLWRDFIWKLNGEIQNVEAQDHHFKVVSKWLWFTCVDVLDATKCGDISKKVQADVSAKIYFNADGTTGPQPRAVTYPYSVSIMPAIRMARPRPKRQAPVQSVAKPKQERAVGAPVEKRRDGGTTGKRPDGNGVYD